MSRTWDANDYYYICPGCGAITYNAHGYCGSTNCTPPEILEEERKAAEQADREQEEIERRYKGIAAAKKHFADEFRNLTFKVSTEDIRKHIIDDDDAKPIEIKKNLVHDGAEIAFEAQMTIMESEAQEELDELGVIADVEFDIYGVEDDDEEVSIYLSVYCARKTIFDWANNPAKFAQLINKGFGKKWGYNLLERGRWTEKKVDKKVSYCNLRVELT